MIAKMEASTPAAGQGAEAQLSQLIDRAVKLEDEGDLDGAIGSYEEALLAGFATAEVCYNLALLYKQQLLYEDTITLLDRCLESPEYGASAHYASGECQLALGNLEAAGEHFDHAIARIALDQIADEQVAEVSHVFRLAIDTFTSLDQREHAAALAATFAGFLATHDDAKADQYRSLTAALRGTPAVDELPEGPAPAPEEPTPTPAPAPPGEEAAAPADPPVGVRPLATTTGRLRTVYRRVTDPLSKAHTGGQRPRRGGSLLQRTGQAARWDEAAIFEQRQPEPRRAMPLLRRQALAVGPTIPLVDEGAQPAEIRVLLSRSAEDFGQDHFDAVIDDCQQIITLAPDYLPIHLRLAETYARQGQLAEASAKCRRLIQLYQVREEPFAALSAYRLLGAIDPQDLAPQQKVADLYFAHSTGPDAGLSADVRALVERAEAAGYEEVALDYAERLIAQTPSDHEAIRLAARLYLRAHNAYRALNHFQALLRRDRHDANAVSGANIALTINEGTVHWPSLESLVGLLRDADDATRQGCIALYEATLSNEDDARGNLQVALGLILLSLDETQGAVEQLQASQQAAGTSLLAPVRFALAYGLKQAYAALNDGPAERQWLQRAADMLRDTRARQFAERTKLFGGALSLGALHVGLAESLLRSGKADNATIVLEAAKADLPDDATIRRRLAALYHECGRLGQALDELDDLATRQLFAGKLAEMIETLHQMSALAGDNLTVKTRLVELYFKRGCPDEALLELDNIAAIHQGAGRPDDAAEALRQAADTAWMIGQHDRAYQTYDRVLALAPENVILRQAYINCLLQGGRQGDAADQQRAIAQTFWEQRRVQETIAALHQVIVLDPRDAGSYSLLGEALASVGEYAQAERVYRRLVRLTPDDPIVKAKQTAMAMLAREGRA